MKRFYPNKSNWSVGKRITVQRAFKQFVALYKPVKASSLAGWKFERELATMNVRRNRGAVGLVRAFGATMFFNGAYKGAEND